MKKILFLSLAVLMTVMAFANPVDPDRAAQVAKHFVAQYVKEAVNLEASLTYTHPMPESKQAAIYAFNVGNAFVLVSANDVAHPVLGYSLSRPWPRAAKGGSVSLPSQVSGYLDDLANQIEAAVGQQGEPDRETAAEWNQLLTHNSQLLTTNPPDSVGPLLTTTWDQGQYYNALCPADANGPDGHVYTGCVATAMAQIINYWGYPVHGRGTHSYEINNGMLSVNYDSTNYDYANMPDALTATSTSAQVNAVATLMRDCGVAVNMEYSSFGSNATNIEPRAALINFFRFSPNLSYAEKVDFSNEEWNTIIRENIAANQPIVYNGVIDGGLSGHSFVCDGYKIDGYFHFNFGWSGDGDGWYLTTAINPGYYRFNSLQSILVGIVPDSTGNVILAQEAGSSVFAVDEPLEFCHLLGHNEYAVNYNQAVCRNKIAFFLADTSNQMVIDVLSIASEVSLSVLTSINVYDGTGMTNYIREYSNITDHNPCISYHNAVTLQYGGYSNRAFSIIISQNSDCRTVSNISSIATDSNTFQISWDENGLSTSWKLEYGEEGFVSGEGTSIITSLSQYTLTIDDVNNTYEVRIQPICDTLFDNHIRSFLLNRHLYWTDNVNTEPEGFYIDTDGTIIVSSAEGLAWLAKKTDEYWFSPGWNWQYINRNVSIVSDINLDGYLWNPIMVWYGNINGNGHIIYNLKTGRETVGGLIDVFRGDTIRDIGFRDATTLSGVPLAYSIQSNGAVVFNCFSVNHNSGAGGLLGGANGEIINCYAIGKLAGNSGGLMSGGSANVYNCYSSVNKFLIHDGSWRGLLSGYTYDASFVNCFTDIDSVQDTWSFLYVNDLYDAENTELGYFFGYPENINPIRNVAGFTRSGNTFAHTVPAVSLNYLYDESIDLVTALNQGVVEYNSPLLRTWVWDSTTGLPMFGGYYEVPCANVSNIVVKNIYFNDNYCVAISWQENGTATQWQIKCLPSGVVDNDSAVYFTSYSTNDTIFSLTLGKEYDFYVRPVCDTNGPMVWGSALPFLVDKMYWTDAVTNCPAGYYEDNNGNVTISSAEGLAWLAVICNSDDGWIRNYYQGKTIDIVEDIDLGKFRWNPIPLFKGALNGESHSIHNLYINERARDNEYAAFIGLAENTAIRNLIFVDGYISGRSMVGTLCGGSIEGCTINNCHVRNAVIKGEEDVGGLVGMMGYEQDKIINSSTTGLIYGDNAVGGLVGFNNGVISNCYSTVDIVHLGDVRPDSKGGLVGGVGGYISNCYAGGNVEYTFNPMGNTLGGAWGLLYPDCMIENAYGKRQDIVPLIGYSNWGSHIISDTATFNNWGVFETGVNIANIVYSNLLDALNAWVGAYDTIGIYRHWAADSTGENGGFPVFAAIPCTLATGSDSVTVCDSYTWHGNVYITLTELVDTLSTMMGCDSIVTHHLIVNHSATTSDTVTACEDYFFDGQWIYNSGQYIDTLATTTGCDSIMALNLIINNPVHTAITEVACDSYTWQGAPLTVSGDYTYPHNDANGCTQVDTLHLTVNHSNTGDTTATACDSFTWWNTSYTNSTNTPTHVYVNVAGCDSTVTLHLTINNSVETMVTDTAVGSYTWNDSTYTETGNYQWQGITAEGCDSTVTLILFIHNPEHTAITLTACDRFFWNDQEYTVTGDYTYSHLDFYGGTQVDTLHLTINYSVETTVTDTAENSYTWNGTTYTESGTYQWIGTTVDGCDSTVTLLLTIISSHEGILNVESTTVRLYSRNGQIVVKGAEGMDVYLYDVVGRRLNGKRKNEQGEKIFDVPAAGVYMVKVGTLPAKRVVVVR